MASTMQGQNMCLWISTGATKVCIALATSASIEIAAETREISSKDSVGNWIQNVSGKLSWTASSDNLYTVDETASAVTYSTLANVMIARTTLTVTFGTVQTTDGGAPQVLNATVLTGSALITALSLNAPNDDTVTFSVSLTGVGALTRS